MSPSELEILRHILDEAEYLLDRARNLTAADYLEDPTLQRAFVRSLEIHGGSLENARTTHTGTPHAD